MLPNKVLNLRKYQQLSLIILVCIISFSGAARAKNLNADFVLKEMSTDERVGYISGVVEGLAYARFLRDRPSEKGMNCVYGWYGNGGAKQWKQIQSWFERHPDKPVGALLYVLIKKECGA